MNINKNFIKKSLAVFNTLVLLTCIFSSINVEAATEPPGLTSKGIALIDGTTGQLLFSRNPDTQYFPASTTKILTALVVLENAKLDEKVTVGKTPANIDGTSIGLKEGEVFTVEELLLGLLMESGNDCAGALAEHVSGSNEEFAKLMNKRAKEAGATNSNFKNPSGLPDPEHVTTPRDLALIMREAIKNPEFIRICRTYSLQLSPSNLDGTRRWVNNHNYIIDPKHPDFFYKYAVASKKGYTTEANFTNIMSAEKDGHTIIVSCLNGEGMSQVYSDVSKVCDYGFNNFELAKLYSKGDKVGSIKVNDETEVPLLVDKDIYYAVETSEKDKLNISIDYNNPEGLKKKRISEGDVLTSGKVMVNGTEVSDVDLVSGIDREADSKFDTNNILNRDGSAIEIGAAIVILSAIAFIFTNKKRQVIKKKKFTNSNYR